MATGLTWRRIAGPPNALALAGALLALAAFGQAISQAVSKGAAAPADGGIALYAVALCVLALANTLPLIFLRPVPAVAAITAASVLVFAAFGTPTVAGLTAQVIASYRFGRMAGLGRASPAGDGGEPGHATEAGHAGRRRTARRRPSGAVPGAGAGSPRQRGHRSARRAGPGRGRRRDRAAGPGRGGAAERGPGDAGGHADREPGPRRTRPDRARAARRRRAPHLDDRGAGRDRAADHPGPAGGGGAAVRRDRRHRPGRADGDAAAARGAPRGRRRYGRRPAPAARAGAAGRADRQRPGGVGRRRQADRVRPGRAVRPRRRAGRVPDRAGGAHERPPARAGRRRGCRAVLRGPDAAAAGQGQRPGPGGVVVLGAGASASASAEGPGHGLLGMRERAATVGGSLRTGAASGGGFLVEAVLPAKPEAT